MKRKVTLSRRKADWVGNRTVNLKGLPLRTNEAMADRNAARLVKEVDRMTTDVNREIFKLFRSDTAKEYAMDSSISSLARILINKLSRNWGKYFKDIAPILSNTMIKNASKQSSSSLKSSINQLSGGMTIKTDSISGTINDIILASADESTGLIKTISQSYIEQVRGDVMRSITGGEGSGIKALRESIHEKLNDRASKQRNKAKNMALDQTRKVYNNLTSQRMKNAGLRKAEWGHSGGSQNPREDHVKLDGKIIDLDNPPVINSRTGERGLPGDEPNCKCFLIPVIEFEDGVLQ